MSDTSPEAGPTSLRSSAPNPLRINLGTIGVDNGGGLQCFGQGPVPCLVSDGVSYVDNNDTSQGRFAQYRYAGPVYVTVDVPNTAELQVEYNLDGSAPSCSSAGAKACTFYHSGDLAIQMARAVSYSGKTRIVLYAASTTVQQTQGWFDYSMPNAATLPRCSNLTVWVCSSGSGPKQISVLNITDALSSVNKLQLTQSSFDTADETLGPLEPGPTVRIQILVATSLTDAALTEMREQLCCSVECFREQRAVPMADVGNGGGWGERGGMVGCGSRVGNEQQRVRRHIISVDCLAHCAFRIKLSCLLDEVPHHESGQLCGVHAAVPAYSNGQRDSIGR